MDAKAIKIEGAGNGPIDSFINGLSNQLGFDIKVADYHQTAISSVLMQKLLPILSLKKMAKRFGSWHSSKYNKSHLIL